MNKNTALISGSRGQDAAWISRLLLDKGWNVFSFERHVQSPNYTNIKEILNHPNFHLEKGDVTDMGSLSRLMTLIKPEHIYHLAANSISSDSLCPIMFADRIDHVTLEKLWNNITAKKNKAKTIKDIDGKIVEVIDIPNNKQIKALGYWNGMGTWLPIKQISRHKYKNKIVKMYQKFGSIKVTPNHSVIDTYGNICSPLDNPWLLNIRKINNTHKRVNTMDLKAGNSFKVDSDGWMKDKNSHNKVMIRRHLCGENLEAFCRFAGAYIAEGCSHYNKINGGYQVIISNSNIDWLKDIETDIKKFFIGSTCYSVSKKDGCKDVYNLCMSSKILYLIVRKLFGLGSKTKKLFSNFIKLDKKYLKLIFDKMIEGDGCIEDGQFRYGTSSYKLACQFSMMITILGYDYTVCHSYIGDNLEDDFWNFRETEYYQIEQGDNGKKIEMEDYDGYVYDIAVDKANNFTVGIGNIVVHNSFVGCSWQEPTAVLNVNAGGTLNMLEAMRTCSPDSKFLLASTSEVVGNSKDYMQNEDTIPTPRSPYAVAKNCAENFIKVYRDSHKLFACFSRCHNHETVVANTPIIFKHNNKIDIKPISEVVKYHTNDNKVSIDESNNNYQESDVTSDLQIWDNGQWTKVVYCSAYPHDVKNDNKKPLLINGRHSCFMATGTHEAIMEDLSAVPINELKIGDKLNLSPYPDIGESSEYDISEDEAYFLGFFVAEGSHSKDNQGAKISGKNKEDLEKIATLWQNIGGKNSVFYSGKSGFCDNIIWQLRLNGSTKFFQKYKIYNEDRTKRIPIQILSANKKIQLAFLNGYNEGDGLKAGYGAYHFKNFKTNSAVLASGLIYLVKRCTDQDYNITAEVTRKWGRLSIYYSINILTDKKSNRCIYRNSEKILSIQPFLTKNISLAKISRITGVSAEFISNFKRGLVKENQVHSRLKCRKEVKKIVDVSDYEGWFYDLTTESGTFHGGVGESHVHNSPFRGKEFVTRKITDWIGSSFVKISNKYDNPKDIEHYFNKGLNSGIIEQLKLGNLNSSRDWLDARDCVRGMYLMLSQDKADDYVLASGKMRSISQFLDTAFGFIGIDNWKPFIGQDPRYMRPDDVVTLCGDYSKAKKELGWEPEISFDQMVFEMVKNDVDIYKQRMRNG